MARKGYATETTVSVAKSRGEIENLLRTWGAKQMQWSDDFDVGHVMLRFFWSRGDQEYTARFNLNLPTADEIRDECHAQRGGRFLQAKFDKEMERRGMVEHRELALLLKAIFVAVDRGIITAEQVFLPFLEGADGVTVSERVLPVLSKLLTPRGSKALLAAASKDVQT